MDRVAIVGGMVIGAPIAGLAILWRRFDEIDHARAEDEVVPAPI